MVRRREHTFGKFQHIEGKYKLEVIKMRKGIIKKEVENKGIKESDEEKNVFKKLNAVGESRIMRTKTAFGSGTQELMV